jgi:hypothetical protein
MKKHTLTLLGGRPPHGELRVPADVLLDTVGALVEGARQATRFLVEGESMRKGPRPAWLETVCRIEVTGLSPGSAVVALEAPSMASALPEQFGPGHQIPLFAEPQTTIDTESSAVDLFAGVLGTIVAGDRDRIMADRALLDTCVRFVRSARDGFEGVQLEGVAGRSAPLVVRQEDIATIELLRDETPTPRAVRIAGTLDTISATRSNIVVRLGSGETIPARLDDHDTATLKSLFGSRVVLSGLARFRPSGKLLVIDVEHLGPARDADELFASLPVPSRPVAPLLPQDAGEGVSSFFGTWPGDETDDELLAALDAIR